MAPVSKPYPVGTNRPQAGSKREVVVDEKVFSRLDELQKHLGTRAFIQIQAWHPGYGKMDLRINSITSIMIQPEGAYKKYTVIGSVRAGKKHRRKVVVELKTSSRTGDIIFAEVIKASPRKTAQQG